MKDFIYRNNSWFKKIDVELTPSQLAVLNSTGAKYLEDKKRVTKEIELAALIEAEESNLSAIRDLILLNTQKDINSLNIINAFIKVDFENNSVTGILNYKAEDNLVERLNVAETNG